LGNVKAVGTVRGLLAGPDFGKGKGEVVSIFGKTGTGTGTGGHPVQDREDREADQEAPAETAVRSEM